MAFFDQFVYFVQQPQALNVPDFTLPIWLKKINQKLPQTPHAYLLCAALNWAIKKGILPFDDLQTLNHHTFCVEVLDGGTSAFFTFDGTKFHPIQEKSAQVYFKAKCAGFLQLLLRQEDPDTLFFKRKLQLEGETELGLFIKNMLDSVEMPKIKMPGFSQ